jgi:hypothetical protein
MRIVHTPLALLFGLTVAISAGAQSQAMPADRTPSFDGRRAPDLSLSEKPAEGPAIERYRLPPHRSSAWNFGNGRMDADPTCFVMRTYRMTRVDRTSDVVQPGRTTVCETEGRYSVRSAVQEKGSTR